MKMIGLIPGGEGIFASIWDRRLAGIMKNFSGYCYRHADEMSP